MRIYDFANFYLSHLFLAPFYFLTKEDISMKCWEMIENILVHIGLVH